jgi:glyoxylase-like metal-dependent hydrolase (beta-lactamase superfamily II)
MIKVTEYCGVRVFQGKVSVFGTGSLKTYAFWWDGNLVDTGPGSLARQFLPAFAGSRIDRVLLTHFHEDHAGNAASLQRKLKVPVYASEDSLGLLQKDAALPLYRRLIWGKRPGFEPSPYTDTVESAHGRLGVLKTPGHSHDHICLINRQEGFLFTGDLFVTPRTRIVMRYESIPEIIKSLKKLLQEEFATLFCAHAGVVEKGRELVGKKLDYLEDISGKVAHLHRQGLSMGEIDRRIFGRTQMLDYISLNEWSSRHIVRSIIQDIHP